MTGLRILPELISVVVAAAVRALAPSGLARGLPDAVPGLAGPSGAWPRISGLRRIFMKRDKWPFTGRLRSQVSAVFAAAACAVVGAAPALSQTDKPNILVIMADDVGWASLSSYHGGIKSIETPNLDRLAAQGARMTDYYAEPSCTPAGRPSSPVSFRCAPECTQWDFPVTRSV
jgi:hypothetical protein